MYKDKPIERIVNHDEDDIFKDYGEGIFTGDVDLEEMMIEFW